MDQLGSAVLNDFCCLAVGFVIAEPGFISGGFTGAFAGNNFGDFSPKFVGPLALSFADLFFDGLGDGDPFGGREVLSDFVLGVFASDDAGYIHDAGEDRLLFEDVPMCSESAFTEDKLQRLSDADGLKEAVLPNAVGQGREVAHVLAVAVADLDVGDFEGLKHGVSVVLIVPFSRCITAATAEDAHFRS